MAVKQCLECGGEVERGERVCPHCGADQKPLVTRMLAWAIGLAATLVIVPFFLYLRESDEFQFGPGKPALTVQGAVGCVSPAVMKEYQEFSVMNNQAGIENLLAGGCLVIQPDFPVTILERTATGLVHVQGFVGAEATQYWMTEQELKPYKKQ